MDNYYLNIQRTLDVISKDSDLNTEFWVLLTFFTIIKGKF